MLEIENMKLFYDLRNNFFESYIIHKNIFNRFL
jgi:hypothetical protein